MLFDSEFIIRLAGQGGKPWQRRALAFIDANLDAPLYTSRICWTEFAEGCDSPAEVAAALDMFTVLEIDERVAWHASRIGRLLKGRGLHIGDNDIWIAATALAHALPLVSNNAKHFTRVPGLELRAY
ncbi:type II toxin-antitoxin system VapC family toxin [Termitidicoccus mucosus]|uniref:Ribonuclease VapC n=1 Tax=Termitidicoccus mucosus TaxID=1184151 RepID=A0A178IEY6_9BACT|nr:hypothetical protein AW736_21955 [Opitutaceae bacterium TSB47]